MKLIVRYLPLVIIAVVWEASSRLGLVSSMSLPPLSDVIKSGIDMIRDGELVTNGLTSLYRAAAGLGLAVVIGAVLGLAMAWWKPVNVLLAPIVEIFYPLPKSALIPVTVIWLGFGDGSKILLIFLGCMLPVTLGAFNGVINYSIAAAKAALVLVFFMHLDRSRALLRLTAFTGLFWLSFMFSLAFGDYLTRSWNGSPTALHGAAEQSAYPQTRLPLDPRFGRRD